MEMAGLLSVSQASRPEAALSVLNLSSPCNMFANAAGGTLPRAGERHDVRMAGEPRLKCHRHRAPPGRQPARVRAHRHDGTCTMIF